jgi:hypothetical protein
MPGKPPTSPPINHLFVPKDTPPPPKEPAKPFVRPGEGTNPHPQDDDGGAPEL